MRLAASLFPFMSVLLAGCGKNSVGTSEFHWSARLGQRGHIAQDAQKGQTSHPPNPGAPRRAVPRARTQRAKRRGGTYRTLCGPFALAMGLGERKSPYSVSDSEKLLLNVEPLSDVRTKLADFFSILLGIFITSRRTSSPFSRPSSHRRPQATRSDGLPGCGSESR